MTISSTDLTTFSVAAVLETIAQQFGIDLVCDGMDDDQCFGFVFNSDTTFDALLQQHQLAYDFLILDGDPITLKRRAVNADLSIDFTLQQSDCVTSGSAPAIKFTRADPLALPREVEIQYMDPDRFYATNTQVARHHGASTHAGKLTISLAFVISADQARTMAFDVLYRIWGSQMTMTFETKDLRIEAGDCGSIESDDGTFTVLVTQSLITKSRTNQISARVLLTSKGVSISSGQIIATDPSSDAIVL